MRKYARRIDLMAETATVVKGLFGALGDPELISLGIGAPAKEALPIDIVREISDDILRWDSRGVEALQYGPTAGAKELREVVAELLLPSQGLHDVAPDRIMITVGGLESLSLTCELFIDPGDIILVESPTFVHAVETFEMFEARCIGVQMDNEGIVIEDLEEKIKKYRPKMVYIIPTFQNPSGRTLCRARRKRVAELAAEYGVLVLEDDPYREIRYSGEDLPAIKSYDTIGNVIYCNSFSKIFSAGSRLGYMVANDGEMMEHLKSAKSALNSHTSLLPQILCAEFFRRGYYPEHRRRIRDLYRERRDTMVECLRTCFPQGSKFAYPDGGLFTWVELPGDLDTTLILKEAVSRPDVKVSYVAGEKFFVGDGRVTNCMRISFGAVEPDKIRTAVKRLGGLMYEKANAWRPPTQ